MRSAVVTDLRSSLQIQDLPVPEPGPGEVLVRMETGGLCGGTGGEDASSAG